MTNAQRAVFIHILRGLPEVTMPTDTAGLMIDLDLRHMRPSDKTRQRWVISHDKLPVEYDTKEVADEATVDRIDNWLINHTKIFRTNIEWALKQLEDTDE